MKRVSKQHNSKRQVIARSGKDSRKFQAAIETVFRLTHRREMTSEERRFFGLTAGEDGHRAQPQPAGEP